MNCQGALWEPKETPQPAKSDRLRKRRRRKGDLSPQVNLEMISHDYFILFLLENHQTRPSRGAKVSISLLKPYAPDLLQPSLSRTPNLGSHCRVRGSAGPPVRRLCWDLRGIFNDDEERCLFSLCKECPCTHLAITAARQSLEDPILCQIRHYIA